MTRSKAKQYAYGALAGGFAEGGTLTLGLANLWLLTRILPKEEYGAYAFALAVFGILVPLSTGGLERALLYRLSGGQVSSDLLGGSYASFALITALLFSSAVAIVTVLVGRLIAEHANLQPSQYYWLLISCIALPFQAVANIYSAWFSANGRVPQVRLLALVKPTTYCLGLVLALLFLSSEVGVAVSFIGSSVLAAAVWLFWAGLASLRAPLWPGRFDILYALKLMLTRLAHTGIERIDIIMISILAGASATADYSVAYRLSTFAATGNRVLSPIFMPRLRHSIANNLRPSLAREFAQNRFLEFMFALGTLVLLILIGPAILSSFGDFGHAAGLLVVLGATHAITMAFGPNGRYLNMAGYGTATLVTTTGLLVLAVVLNWALIPPLGALGAAFATVVSIGLVNLITSLLIWRWDRFQTLDPATLFVMTLVLVPVVLVVLGFGWAGSWPTGLLLIFAGACLAGLQRKLWWNPLLKLLSAYPRTGTGLRRG